tara:strand:+ start:10583 stop:10768 length:186 start_codon:yes stop_codon:yes gene_type:complete
MNRYLICYYYKCGKYENGDKNTIVENYDLLSALKDFINKETNIVVVTSIHQLDVEEYVPKF